MEGSAPTGSEGIAARDRDKALWYDERVAVGDKVAQTHALIVGVSHYPFLQDMPTRSPHESFGLSQLDCGAAAAFEIATWLRKVYRNPNAPLGTIRLLLSPSQRERDFVFDLARTSGDLPTATRANVVAALEKWLGDCSQYSDNVALMYICGHGVVIGKDQAVVLLEDFAAEALSMNRSLDIGNVHRHMASIRTRYQFLFVDACSASPGQLQRYVDADLGSGRVYPESAGAKDDRSAAWIFRSAALGTQAFGFGQGRGTVFSNILAECLSGAASCRAGGGNWHVTAHSLAPELEKRVARAAREAGEEQLPVLGGHGCDYPIHVLREPPTVQLVLELAPDEAIGHARGQIRDSDGGLFDDGVTFQPNPYSRPVPAGDYWAEVTITTAGSPFVPRSCHLGAEPPDGVSRRLDVAR